MLTPTKKVEDEPRAQPEEQLDMIIDCVRTMFPHISKQEVFKAAKKTYDFIPRGLEMYNSDVKKAIKSHLAENPPAPDVVMPDDQLMLMYKLVVKLESNPVRSGLVAEIFAKHTATLLGEKAETRLQMSAFVDSDGKALALGDAAWKLFFRNSTYTINKDDLGEMVGVHSDLSDIYHNNNIVYTNKKAKLETLGEIETIVREMMTTTQTDMNDIRSQAHGAAVTIAQLEVVIHYEEKIAFYKETRDAEMEELRESNKAETEAHKAETEAYKTKAAKVTAEIEAYKTKANEDSKASEDSTEEVRKEFVMAEEAHKTEMANVEAEMEALRKAKALAEAERTKAYKVSAASAKALSFVGLNANAKAYEKLAVGVTAIVDPAGDHASYAPSAAKPN